MRSRRIASIVLLGALAACGEQTDSPADAARAPPPTEEVQSDGVPGNRATASLAGTSWSLVFITPEDPALYTLAFDTGGAMRLRADCNRGRGTWMSDGPGQLQFGPIASTRALCPPGSLHEQAGFVWATRSDDHRSEGARH